MKINRWTRMAGALALVLGASQASASNRVDDGWLAWLGCWQPEGLAEQMLCIVPEGAGVRMLSVSAGSVQSESRVIADDQSRAITQEGCTGTERAVWSADLRRVFMQADQVCGERTQRKVSGLLTLVSSSELLSVQSVTSGENTAMRTVRYRAVESAKVPETVTTALRDNRLARQTARQAVAGVIELRDVTEAVGRGHHLVVESWLTEAGQKFDLNGRTLVSLADSGVPSSVIDVLVGVSNPQLFAVRERNTDRDDDQRRGRSYGGSCYDDLGSNWFDPFGYNFGYRYNRSNRNMGYGYDDCRGYSRGGAFGYSPWGYDSYGWRYNAPVIVIRGDSEEGNPDRKVTKRGYSRGSSSGSAESGSSSRSGTSSSVGTTQSTGSTTSGSTSSGTSTGRTAKPRGGN